MTTVFEPATDAGAFAEQVLGAPLWPHQLEVVRSSARYRVLCAGRQVGKSRTMAVEALHTAATRRNALVMLVSAGEAAAIRLLADCAALASGSPLLAGSVLDDESKLLTLSNGSQIRAVPASFRQLRGWPIDLLVLDEAGFIANELWQSAEPAIIARPGSRVILSSSPWGGRKHFFRQLWDRGTVRPDEQVRSWRWPSVTSPLVDAVLLEEIRQRSAPDYFAREYEAEWTDASGAYFTEAEIMDCVADYQMMDAGQAAAASPWRDGPGALRVFPAAVGLDWGLRRDSNVVALVAPLEDEGLNDEILGPEQRALFVPWIHGAPHWPWHEFADYVVELCQAYQVEMVASEINGVGDAATSILRVALQRARLDIPVAEVWTDVRRKQAGFGQIRALLQRRRLVLPRHPELLRQLHGLEFTQLDGGSVRIAVPDNIGHDDLAMALLQAVSCVRAGREASWGNPGNDYYARPGDADAWRTVYRKHRVDIEANVEAGTFEIVTTPGGIRLPLRPEPLRDPGQWVYFPQGHETSEKW